MTVPNERTLAVLRARDFLIDLCSPKTTPRVPKAVRQQASRILKHFPSVYDLTTSSSKLPDCWGEPDNFYTDSSYLDRLSERKPSNED